MQNTKRKLLQESEESFYKVDSIFAYDPSNDIATLDGQIHNIRSGFNFKTCDEHLGLSKEIALLTKQYWDIEKIVNGVSKNE